MQAAIMRVTIDRTGRQLGQKIIGFEEIDEDTYYRPLVEVLGDKILASCKEEQEKSLTAYKANRYIRKRNQNVSQDAAFNDRLNSCAGK